MKTLKKAKLNIFHAVNFKSIVLLSLWKASNPYVWLTGLPCISASSRYSLVSNQLASLTGLITVFYQHSSKNLTGYILQSLNQQVRNVLTFRSVLTFLTCYYKELCEENEMVSFSISVLIRYSVDKDYVRENKWKDGMQKSWCDVKSFNLLPKGQFFNITTVKPVFPATCSSIEVHKIFQVFVVWKPSVRVM